MIAICLFLMLQQEQPAQPEQPAPVREEAAGPSFLAPLRGNLTALYRTRWTTDESDNDLYEFLTAQYGTPETDLVSASLSARFAEDLDGQRKVNGFFVFNSIDDTYQSAASVHVYTAYVTVNKPLPGLMGQIGRQVVDAIPEAVPMDGLMARYQFSSGVLKGATVGAFGGKQADLWKSSTSGDLMFGGWAEYAFLRGRARLEYLHLKDENVFDTFKDDLLGLTVVQTFGVASTYGRFTMLEGNARDLTARATVPFTRYDLMVDGQINYGFKTVRALAFPIDPYSTFLLPLAPYAQISLRAVKGLTDKFSVEAAATIRELVSESKEGPFNHEFQHWSLTPRASNWPVPRLSLALSFDFWQSHDDFWTLGGDATYELVPKKVTIGAGTAFSLYSIDAIEGIERERIREVYVTAKWKAVEDTVVDFKFSIDRDNSDTFNTIDVGVRRAF